MHDKLRVMENSKTIKMAMEDDGDDCDGDGPTKKMMMME
jgi:hypothetical protein